jgi:hypothetical protein
MRYFTTLLLILCLFAVATLHAKQKYRGMPRTEVALINNIASCLKYKDSLSYFYQFPPFDSLWKQVMHNSDHSPETVKELNALREHPQSLIEFDPHFNPRIMGQFLEVLRKGEDSGIHWKNIVIQRYELHKQPLTRNLIGYEKIAPERFTGYLFVRDLLGRLTFCISVAEIQKINGYFFGGQVLNILEADNIDQFHHREQEEQRYFAWLAAHPPDEMALRDSLRNDSIKNGLIDTSLIPSADTSIKRKPSLLSVNPVDDEKSHARKEVIDRKYYEGKFDDEIPVKVFIRYMRDPKGIAVYYDGLYKFGDQQDYVKLTINKNADGKWMMDDETPLGSMELELKAKVYTGSWTNTENQTGYDVVLTQTDLPQKKLEQLDNILERGLSGRVDEEAREEKQERKTAKKKDKEDEKDKDDEKDNFKENNPQVAKELRKSERKERRRIKRALEGD